MNMMKKPNFKNPIINWKKEYLQIFKDIVLSQLYQGITPEQIIDFTDTLNFDIIQIDVALIAGFIKYTTVKERQQILLNIEKGK